MAKTGNEEYSSEETASRRDAVIRRMANTAPQPKAISPSRPKKKKKAVAGHAVRKARAHRAD